MVTPTYVTEIDGAVVVFNDNNYQGWVCDNHIFVEKGSRHYDWDLEWGRIFSMDQEDWDSWFDGTERKVSLDFIRSDIAPGRKLNMDVCLSEIRRILADDKTFPKGV